MVATEILQFDNNSLFLSRLFKNKNFETSRFLDDKRFKIHSLVYYQRGNRRGSTVRISPRFQNCVGPGSIRSKISKFCWTWTNRFWSVDPLHPLILFPFLWWDFYNYMKSSNESPAMEYILCACNRINWSVINFILCLNSSSVIS